MDGADKSSKGCCESCKKLKLSSTLCVHGRRYTCRLCCGPNSRFYCKHGRAHAMCAMCGGSALCTHGRKRSNCKECGGASICRHGKLRTGCKECVPASAMVRRKLWCIGCCDKMLSAQRQRANIRLCAECDQSVPPRLEKVVVAIFVQELAFEPSSLDNVFIGGSACNTPLRRPDACWISERVILCLEIDEHGHIDRDPHCEIAKVVDQTLALHQAFPHAIVYHIRFDPHGHGKSTTSNPALTLTQRIGQVVVDMKILLRTETESIHHPYVLYYFYSEAATRKHIHFTLHEAAESVRVLTLDNGILGLLKIDT